MDSIRYISPEHIAAVKAIEPDFLNFELMYSLCAKANPSTTYIFWQQVLASILYISFNSWQFMPFYTYSFINLALLEREHLNCLKASIIQGKQFFLQRVLDGCTCFKDMRYMSVDFLADIFESFVVDRVISDASELDDIHLENCYNNPDYLKVRNELYVNQDSLFDLFNRQLKHKVFAVNINHDVEIFSLGNDYYHPGVHLADRISPIYEDLLCAEQPITHASVFTAYLLTGNATILDFRNISRAGVNMRAFEQIMNLCWLLFVDSWSITHLKRTNYFTVLLNELNKNFLGMYQAFFVTDNPNLTKYVRYIPIQEILSRRDDSSAAFKRILRHLLLTGRNPFYFERLLHLPAYFAWIQWYFDEFGLTSAKDIHFDVYYTRTRRNYRFYFSPYAQYLSRKFGFKKFFRPVLNLNSLLESQQGSQILQLNYFKGKLHPDTLNQIVLDYLKVTSTDSFDFICNYIALFSKNKR